MSNPKDKPIPRRCRIRRVTPIRVEDENCHYNNAFCIELSSGDTLNINKGYYIMTEEELTQLLNATDEAIDKAIKIMQRVMKIQDHPVCSHKKIDKNADNNDEHST